MKKQLITSALCAIALLSGCAHYTARDGLNTITQEPDTTIETRYRLLNPDPIPQDPDKVMIENQAKTIKQQQETISSQEATIQELSRKTSALSDENARLSSLASEQEAKLAMNDSMISDLSGKVVGLQSKVNIENEKREQEQKEAEAKAKALATLEPLEEISYPKYYRVGETLTTTKNQPVTVCFLPLGESTYSDTQISEILESESDLKSEITFVTGNKENTYKAVKASGRSAVLTEWGAIITSYAVEGEPGNTGATVRLDGERTLSLGVVNLPQLDMLEQMGTSGDWKGLVSQRLNERKDALRDSISGTEGTSRIIAASLYEPASSDWQELTAFSWRDTSFSWPLAEYLSSQGWNDTYRQTHYSVESDAGNTLQVGGVFERTDFLFNRNVIPLESNVVNMGPASIEEDGYARFGLVASYLVP